jgi:hypothetical protein
MCRLSQYCILTCNSFIHINLSVFDTCLSLVLFVQEPALQLLPLNTRHLYSSQACLQRCSSWPALVFRSSSKCPIMNCSVFFFHRKSHFWHQFVTYSWVLFHNGTLLHSKFNTQLLITISNSSRILTHVQPLLVLWYNPQITLRTHGCVLSIRVSEHDSTVLERPPFHSNASVTLLYGNVRFIVMWTRLFSLLR